MLVTSWLCGRSPAHVCRRCRSVCIAVASWDIGALKHWAGRWCRREAGYCYWSRCGSRCPCRPRRCPGPRLFPQSQRETGQSDKARRSVRIVTFDLTSNRFLHRFAHHCLCIFFLTLSQVHIWLHFIAAKWRNVTSTSVLYVYLKIIEMVLMF